MIRPILTAAVASLGLAGSLQAGWTNVAQLTCGDCRPRTSYKAPDCEKPEIRRSYVQRTYYQPQTEWKAEKYLEPVKVNVRSSFYEPVTSYSYSSYYDPCSGQCQQIATPRTEYRLRESCNTAYKYVERTRMVPVQTLKPVTYMQPVVSYYYPPRPVVGGQRLIDPSEVEPYRAAPQTEIERMGGSELIPNQKVPATPPQAMPEGTSRARTAGYTRATGLRGELVERDRVTPKAETKLIFLNAADKSRREIRTNGHGEFDVALSAGEWHVYVGTGTGTANFHSTVTLKDGQTRDVTVASR
jgi:hypothetical protein